MGRPLTGEEFGELFRGYERTAFRLELQRQYSEPIEADTFAKFVAGDPQPPTEVPELAAWFTQVREQTTRGLRMERVRVHEDPPTDYQRWERWIGAWNIASGEVMRYMTRAKAREVGLLPAAGDKDWWLLDETQLIVMTFDGEGRRLSMELITDQADIDQACTWRDLAIRHSTLETT